MTYGQRINSRVFHPECGHLQLQPPDGVFAVSSLFFGPFQGLEGVLVNREAAAEAGVVLDGVHGGHLHRKAGRKLYGFIVDYEDGIDGYRHSWAGDKRRGSKGNALQLFIAHISPLTVPFFIHSWGGF